MPRTLHELDEVLARWEEQALRNKRASTLVDTVEETCERMLQAAVNDLSLIGSMREVLELAIGMQDKLKTGKEISQKEIRTLETALGGLNKDKG